VGPPRLEDVRRNGVRPESASSAMSCSPTGDVDLFWVLWLVLSDCGLVEDPSVRLG
jgi:hypothetical protein